MKLVGETKLPDSKKYVKGKLQELIDKFSESEYDIVKIDYSPEEYKSITTCVETWRTAIKRSKRRIRIHQRSGNVYLVKY